MFPDPRSGLPLDKAAVLRRMRTAMAAAGVPMRTLQEWMGHRDIETTQRYADYAPRTRDAELVAAAFDRDALNERHPVEQVL